MVVKLLFFGVVGLVAIISLVLLLGVALPRTHVASGKAAIAARPERVAEAMRNLGEQPRWREDLASVSDIQRSGLTTRYREVSKDGEAVEYRLTELMPDRVFETEILSKNLPYGGKWTIELTPTAEGTVVQITERGFVTNPLYRVVGRFVLGYDATLRKYLSALQKFNIGIERA